MTNTYQEKANNLAKAIDVAIDAIQKYPPKEFQAIHVENFVKTYREFKEKALYPEPQFMNLKSIKYIDHDVFTYFQESTGEAIEYFWKQIKNLNLPYVRDNKLSNILTNNKIKNQIEYNYVIDMITVASQEKLIDNNQLAQLNKLIEVFEKKKR